MSAGRNKKDYLAPYEMLRDWDEVVIGDETLFKEMTEPYLAELLHAACKSIRRERAMGELQPDILQPEELVGETLIQAWQARHGRTERRSLKEWLLEIQEHALRAMVIEEKKLHAHIAASLDDPAPTPLETPDENEYWQWVEPPLRERLDACANKILQCRSDHSYRDENQIPYTEPDAHLV